MMKDVQATLRRIDEELTGHTQLIARSRVEIARLQETRLVLMGLAESDVAAADTHREEHLRGLAMNGAHAKPMLIVRKTGSDEPFNEGLNKSGNRRGLGNKGGKRGGSRVHPGSELGKYRERVTKLLADAPEPMASREMADYFGLPRNAEARKPLQNALYQMRVAGVLQRAPDKRYFMPRLTVPNGAQS